MKEAGQQLVKSLEPTRWHVYHPHRPISATLYSHPLLSGPAVHDADIPPPQSATPGLIHLSTTLCGPAEFAREHAVHTFRGVSRHFCRDPNYNVARWCNGKAFGLAISRSRVQILLETTLRNNLRQVVYTYVPLSCITWYRPKGGDALRLGR